MYITAWVNELVQTFKLFMQMEFGLDWDEIDCTIIAGYTLLFGI